MRCIADVHYEVLKDYNDEIKALCCKFCPFSVLKCNVPKPRSSKSGRGRYNRMRGMMVRHLHAEHRDQLTVEGAA